MAEILTAPGGQIKVTDDLRGMLAYLSDGRLLVSKVYASHPLVLGFKQKLKYLGYNNFKVELVDLSIILSLYQSKEQNKKNDYSDMQNSAISIINKAVNMRASDIHIRVSEKEGTRIYFRVHGDLKFIEDNTHEYGEKLCTTIYQAMTDVSDSTFEPTNRQDARISDRKKIPSNLDGIRIATTPQVDGFIMVMRLIYNDAGDVDLTGLGYDSDQIISIEYMKHRPTGIMIVSGPTGSGKSTTLQRILTSIIKESKGKKHVLTVEDPPEYPIIGAVQTPVTNAQTEEERKRKFHEAIRAAMRLDPDVIMISEVRDEASAQLAVRAAMTGHQVWTTVHANNAITIFDRLLDLGVPIKSLTDPTIVGGLIAQRLVKVLCPKCKVPIKDKLNDIDKSALKRFMRVLDMDSVYVEGDGCEYCRHTGTNGRTVLSEVIVTDDQFMEIIRAGDRIRAIDYVRREQGIMSMLDHAIKKVNLGIVDPFHAESEVGYLNSGIIDRDHRITPEELRS